MSEEFDWRLEGCEDYVQWTGRINQDASDWISSNRIEPDENDTPETAARAAAEFIKSEFAIDGYTDDEINDMMAEYFEDLEGALRTEFEEVMKQSD